MCGRVIQSSRSLRLAIVEGLDLSDNRTGNIRLRYNAAPSQELLVIRENHKTGERSLDPIRWGLIPHWCSDPSGGRKPINAKAESVSRLPMFREAYALRRCIVPIDGFFVAVGFKNDWHPIVDLAEEIIRGRSDDGEGPFPSPCLGVVPILP